MSEAQAEAASSPPASREPPPAAGRGTVRHLPVLGNNLALSGGIPSRSMQDGKSRPITYVRISLTDRCNYRCTYCMPAEGVDLVSKNDILSFEEIEVLVQALMQVGVRRVRLTGGEPTVRKDLVALVERLGRLGLDDLALSTNGERLDELAGPLRRAGLHRLNVSLDTLNPERFAQVTRRGHLERVLAGLEAVRAAGFPHTKLNAVAMRGFNDDEVGALCRYAFDRDFIPRFIELMPMAEGALFYPGTFLPAAALREILVREFGPLQTSEGMDIAAVPGVGPARSVFVRYRGNLRRVGVISAVTEPFCDTCNRVRLSSTGELHACLAYDDAIDLRRIVRSPELAEQPPSVRLEALIDAAQAGLLRKRDGHVFSTSGCGGPQKHMVSIGG
jgi:cyclic pyranopterin phosphate synthase